MNGADNMVRVVYRYVHEDRDRHGRVRLYFWRRPGPKIRIRAELGSEAFAATYALLRDGPPSQRAATRAPENTLAWLCLQYYGSADFRRLDPSTQIVRKRVLNSCLAEPVSPGSDVTYGAVALPQLSAKALRILRDRKAATPEAANSRVKALRRVYAAAMADDLVLTNPAADLTLFKSGSSGHHSWTLDEVERYEAQHPIGTKARLAMALMLYTGARISDAARLGRQHIGADGWLRFTAHKGRRHSPSRIEIPVLPDLARALAAGPTGDLTFLVTEHGRAHSIKGLGNWFRRQCNMAGLPHCSAHGLRKAGATRMANGGATAHQLMAVFGWKSLAEAELYTRAAGRRRLAGDAVHLLSLTPIVPTAARSGSR